MLTKFAETMLTEAVGLVRRLKGLLGTWSVMSAVAVDRLLG